jgi:DNA-binding response OmpR family regulator
MTDQICINSVDGEPDQLLGFVLTPNQEPSRERLPDLAHGHGSEPFDRGIDVRISRIRRKSARQNRCAGALVAGYMFVPSKP